MSRYREPLKWQVVAMRTETGPYVATVYAEGKGYRWGVRLDGAEYLEGRAETRIAAMHAVEDAIHMLTHGHRQGD